MNPEDEEVFLDEIWKHAEKVMIKLLKEREKVFDPYNDVNLSSKEILEITVGPIAEGYIHDYF